MLKMTQITTSVMMRMMMKRKKTRKRKSLSKKSYKQFRRLLQWFKMPLVMQLTFVRQ